MSCSHRLEVVLRRKVAKVENERASRENKNIGWQGNALCHSAAPPSDCSPDRTCSYLIVNKDNLSKMKTLANTKFVYGTISPRPRFLKHEGQRSDKILAQTLFFQRGIELSEESTTDSLMHFNMFEDL